MTTRAPERGALAPPAAAAVEPGSAGRGSSGGPPASSSAGQRGVLATCVGAWLASSAVGVFVAGLFADPLARVVALGGALLGAGVVLASCRTRYTAAGQYAGALLTVLLGAFLVLPFATGGSASLPGLISEALHSGGLGRPPVPFDPGWRFLLFVLTGLLGEASAAAAVGLARPKVAVGLPVPLLVGAALLEPTASAASTLASLALLVAALAVSFGVQLATEGVGSARFEVRRFARGAVLAVVLVAGMAALSRVGFLFPRAVTSAAIPPRRPPSAPPLSDRVLFTVTTPTPMTWRLGVLDVYQTPAWLLPPYDTARILRIPASGTVPVDGPGSVVGPLRAANTITVRFTVGDLPGHGMPDLANPIAVHASTGVQYDPRTQTLQLPELAPRALSYTVQAVAPPSDGQLRAAGPPRAAVAPFLAAPPPPPRVAALLARAPTGNRYDRLQFVRQAFYSAVIAAGAGNPVDVSPNLVDRMLAGQPVSPYEITAGEVLLARWAGVPARIGYGYFGGHPVPGSPGVYQIHPDDGATWLEAYFQGYGWVPIVGTPPRAKASLSSAPKQHNPTVRPTDQLALMVYVPYPQQSLRQLYQVVRYWLLRGLLALLILVLALLGYPAVVKWLRTLRRVRWAARHGPPERIAVAYAGMRDAAGDLGIGGAHLPPVEFLGRVEPDAEHRELAWLVVRGLWGDLRRDLRGADADAAVDLAASVSRRLRRAQPMSSRVLAAVSRESLRQPHTREIPNLWWRSGPAATVAATRGRGRPGPVPLPAARGARLRARQRGAAAWLVLLPARIPVRVVAAGLSCLLVGVPVAVAATTSGHIDTGVEAPGVGLPNPAAPAQLGPYRFVPVPAAAADFTSLPGPRLVDAGRVFTVRQGGVIQGSLQVASFAPRISGLSRKVRFGVLKSLGVGQFQPTRLGSEHVYELSLPDETLLLAFSPSGRYYQLMVARAAFTDASQVFASVLAFDAGQDRGGLLENTGIPRVDPREGSLQ